MLLVATVANAFAQITQITSNDDADCTILRPAVSADGAFVAFESNCDLLGTNGDGNREIFVYARTSLAGIQITDSAGCASTTPSITADGSAVAFDSDCNLDNLNADGSVEIFHWNGTDSSQMTNGLFCDSLAPSLSSDGALIAFDSNCDHVGQNTDFSNEIFQSTTTGVIAQRTSDSTSNGCGSFDASSDFDGTTIAFVSDCDLAGGNENGVVEIFQYTGAVAQLTADPTDSGCGSANPSSSADGAMIVFESDCDFLGTNVDEVVEIFRVSSQGVVEQLTDDAGTSGCESIQPSSLADGDVVYASSCDPLGTNADSSLEIFEVGPEGTTQHTDEVGCDSFEPSASADPSLVAFGSDCDPNGGNPAAADQIFLLFPECACGAPVSRQGGAPNATDALFTLQAAVGLTECRLCDCDVDDGGSITALDALTILNAAVGIDVPLTCP